MLKRFTTARRKTGIKAPPQNHYLTYTSPKQVMAIRNVLCYGIFIGRIAGFIDDRLSEKDDTWVRHGAKICYFVNSKDPPSNSCFITNYAVVLRHCGRLCGLYPKDDPDVGLMIDELVELSASFKVAFSKNTDQAKADKLLISTFRYFEDTLCKNFAKTGKNVLVGYDLTIADFELQSAIEFVTNPKFAKARLFDAEAFNTEFKYIVQLADELGKEQYVSNMNKREWAHKAEVKAGNATAGEAHSIAYQAKYAWTNQMK